MVFLLADAAFSKFVAKRTHDLRYSDLTRQARILKRNSSVCQSSGAVAAVMVHRHGEERHWQD